MTNVISLQDLKRTGFKKLKLMFNEEPEILIQERGKDACVLVDLSYYSHLIDCALEISLIKARQEIADGNYTTGVKSHIEHLEKVLVAESKGKK